jgi:DNA-binding MarR family transcriptional regulator
VSPIAGYDALSAVCKRCNLQAVTERTSTHQLSRPADPASEEAFAVIGDRFIDAYRAMRRSAKRERMQREVYLVGDRELTPVQVDALEALCLRDRWRMGDIAQELRIDPSTASRTLAPLVDLGLADRTTDPADRRQVHVEATARGRAAADRIAEGRRVLMREVLSCMAPARRVLLTELLEEYVRALETAHPGPPRRS